MDNPKQRHGCLTAWLALMIIANAAVAVMTPWSLKSIQEVIPEFPAWVVWAIAACAALNVIFAIALFQWQRWGFYGFVLSSFVALGLNIYAGIGLLQSILGLAAIFLLYWVLQLGGAVTGWSQLEPQPSTEIRAYRYRSSAGWKYVLRAIFKRDFVSYFSSPTGYVFICVFVVLSALATFWPPEFFANNLANLDQLSRWLPFIMLVFIPAITMSIWAEERRQGTDELLLTIPASDFDVVLGKYLAGVAFFTVSLAFSAISIFAVFKYGLGDPDPGLFLSTYIGYWFIGIAMIAIGMVASFLTSNLTVGFILGTLFNLPLAAFGVADWFVKNPAWAENIRRWGALQQFVDFERGVISLGGVTYFVMIAVVMIYVSMVLIGRRHWQAREEGDILFFHYLTRVLALLAVAAGVTVLIQNRNWLRADVSTEQLSSLSEETRALIEELRDNEDVRSVTIHAYISPQVPSEFQSTKLTLLSTLEELRALGRGKIVVEKHEIQNYGPEAERAEKNFGITPQAQLITEHGETEEEEFFLGVAVTSGLDKVVTPFLNRGIPVEYELIRSIVTVSGSRRLRVGVIETGLNIAGPDGSRADEWPLVAELRKQYDVTSVDPSQPIRGRYDALLAVQPSMLDPESFDNVVDAIRAGTPTAVLEDPFPYFFSEGVPGTGQPKQSGMSMGMFGMPQEEPKGDARQLWRLLGIEMVEDEATGAPAVVWQNYAPELSVRPMQDLQWVFVDHGNRAPRPFNEKNPVTAGLNQVLLLYPGGLTQAADSTLDFEQLLQSGVGISGTVAVGDPQAFAGRPLQRFDPGRQNPNKDELPWVRSRDGFVLAAHITGAPPEDDAALDALDDEGVDPAELDEPVVEEEDEDETELNVIVVADVDWIIPSFFAIREGGDEDFLPATQNVTLILNIIDELTGDDRFLAIRKRTRLYRTLTRIDEATAVHRDRAAKEREEFLEDIAEREEDATTAMQEAIEEVEARTDISDLEKQVLLEQTRRIEQQKLEAEAQALADERRRKIKEIEFDQEQEIRSVQDRYKVLALLLPPIPPLLLALAVFFRRRELERQGVSRERLR
jgi:ABC-2 type transport system permease protein